MFLDENGSFGEFKGDFSGKIDRENEIISEIVDLSSEFAKCNKKIIEIESEIDAFMSRLRDLKDKKEEIQDKMNVLNAELREIKGGAANEN